MVDDGKGESKRERGRMEGMREGEREGEGGSQGGADQECFQWVETALAAAIQQLAALGGPGEPSRRCERAVAPAVDSGRRG